MESTTTIKTAQLYKEIVENMDHEHLIDMLVNCPRTDDCILLDKLGSVAVWMPIAAPRIVAHAAWIGCSDDDILSTPQTMVRLNEETEETIRAFLNLHHIEARRD